ncbi:uncharacterized protein FFUJ_10919 [Fusarium fujikuroi IMI 58289]|uniref:Uncharacterized protein n=1 Tax=Gibberella fujikuroi (strain CBS 195.34 / IMI 58289 / NRRL A-6831) TaxID=1279085 RepID=S0EPB9_GIBF5|nr:uncharacterized protein FFUJ_10919 [Fusarium fujikuroi IMI 58289]CCT74848.1 uncharacterized protein FFUJ_10919 [Fusarium fujikuroi IMI 58289]SCO04603.1 uncharacterized protein FFM5_08332 [Fusarium fujikuroi]SCO57803.1 uncharacterized protein FFMR_14959 [Fusarium fujikuroi]
MTDSISGYQAISSSWLEQQNVVASKKDSSQLRQQKEKQAGWVWTCCACRAANIESSITGCSGCNQSRCQHCEVKDKQSENDSQISIGGKSR